LASPNSFFAPKNCGHLGKPLFDFTLDVSVVPLPRIGSVVIVTVRRSEPAAFLGSAVSAAGSSSGSDDALASSAASLSLRLPAAKSGSPLSADCAVSLESEGEADFAAALASAPESAKATGDRIADPTGTNPAKPSTKTTADSLPAFITIPQLPKVSAPLYSIVGQKSDPLKSRRFQGVVDVAKKPVISRSDRDCGSTNTGAGSVKIFYRTVHNAVQV